MRERTHIISNEMHQLALQSPGGEGVEEWLSLEGLKIDPKLKDLVCLVEILAYHKMEMICFLT